MRNGLARVACLCLISSGCSLVTDFGGFVFESDGHSDSGPEPRDSGSQPGDGGEQRDAAVTRDAAMPRDAGAVDGGAPDGGDANVADASEDAQVDAGPAPDPLCDVAPCDEVAKCSSKTGRAICTCPKGYYDFNGDGTECVDLNECKAGLYQCDDDATCFNTQGGYDCVCNPGFLYDASSRDCLDSCLVLLSTTCDAAVGLCTKPNGEAECRCPAGYMDVNGDGTVCEPDLVCMALGCDPHAQCDGTDVTPACVCPSGYTGNGMVCTDVDECALDMDDCDANAACTNTLGGFVCTCTDGYEGDGKSCSDVNECTAGTHACSANADCSNTVGDYTCACRAGYNGDGFGCADDDECMLGADNCSPNANCTNTPGTFSCACKPGYQGDGETCDDVDECAAGSDDCAPSEACANTQGSFTCGCDPGYRKNASGQCVDVNECAELLANCSSNADCTNTAGGFSCACKSGYGGDGVTCADINECTAGTHNCSANATCSNNAGGFSCACNSGYSGSGVVCNDINECALDTDNCHPTRAMCSNNPGGFSCTCLTGYSGNGVTCSDIDECVANTDTCDGTPDACVNTPGSYSCACPNGYSGNGVGANGCADVNECTLNTDNCDSSPDACTNVIGSFSCVCPSGYNGDGVGASGCADVNECSLNTDTCDGTPDACVNNAGGYTCSCPMGYTGTGQGPSGCADVNECTLNTDNCDSTPDACVNTTGGYTCTCPIGWTMPGNGQGQFGCCQLDGLHTDITHPNDGLDNDCDGLWDRPVIQPANTFPEAGGASSAADVSITITTSVIPSGTLQCRSYRRGTSLPAFATCLNPVHNPALSTSAANDGAWRTEMRWSWPDGRFSHITAYDYYVHSSLHGAPKCPSLGVTDDAIFTAADGYLKAANVGPGRTDPGPFSPGSDTFLANPFVTVTYKPITFYFFDLRRAISVNANAGTPYGADMWSLRKRFVLGSNNRYVLIRRVYGSKAAYSYLQTRDCKVAHVEVLNSQHDVSKPPLPFKYYAHYAEFSCDAVVVNRAGAGVCVNVNTGTIVIGPSHYRNPYSGAPGAAGSLGYALSSTEASDNFMWKHLLDERGWHGHFRQGAYPTAPESGFRNFSQKCDTAGCNNDDSYELYLPDKAILRP